MSNEFDYSGLYHNNATTTNPAASPRPPGQRPGGRRRPAGQAGPKPAGSRRLPQRGQQRGMEHRQHAPQPISRRRTPGPGSQAAAGARPDAEGAAQQPGESGLHQHHARRRSRRVQLRQRPHPAPQKAKGKGQKDRPARGGRRGRLWPSALAAAWRAPWWHPAPA